MKPRMVVIASSGLCRNIKTILERYDIFSGNNILLYNISPEDMLDIELKVKKLELGDDSVIICGAGASGLLSKIYSGSIVPISVSGFDLLKMIKEASLYDNEVSIINFNKNLSLGDWEDCLTVKFKQYIFRDQRELERIFKKLIKEGRKVVIGASLVCDLAKKLGIKAMLYYSEATILDAFQKAQKIVTAISYEHEKKERMRTILDITPTGIIGLDKDNKIVEFNPAAEKMFGIRSKEFFSKHIEAFVSDEEFLSDVKERKAKQDLYRINNIRVSGNLIPINVHDSYRGMVVTLDDVSTIQKTEKIIRKKLSETSLNSVYSFDDIVGTSKAITKIKKQALNFARTDSTILISGESGTGKELFAHSIHSASSRREEAFLAVNCAALPENLLESEFFGYVEGAFTGAVKGGKRGLFEMAHCGTIFLDDICGLPVVLQAKLLRVLQQREIRRIGSSHSIPIDVRVIAATNSNLLAKINNGEFREDFYFRINVLELLIPPLRERPADILPIFEHLVKKHDLFVYLKVKDYLQATSEKLLSYDWPGNIRELENTVERFIAMLKNTDQINEQYLCEVMLDCIPKRNNAHLTLTENLSSTLKNIEISLIRRTLYEVGGNVTAACKKLGISKTTLWRRLNNG